MSQQAIRHKGHELEKLLANPHSSLTQALKRDASRQLAKEGVAASQYDFYAVRRNASIGSEIFGPQKLHVGTYSEEALYGQHASPLFRFRQTLARLTAHARQTAEISDVLEFAHQVALMWSEVAQLREYLAFADEIDELIAAFRSARYQHIGRDTPAVVVSVLAEALNLAATAAVIDTALVDKVVDCLEAAGVDTFAQDAA